MDAEGEVGGGGHDGEVDQVLLYLPVGRCRLDVLPTAVKDLHLDVHHSKTKP